MQPDSAALDGLERQIAEWRATAEERAARSRLLRERTDAITGTAVDPTHLIRVAVNATGELVDLRLAEDVRQHSATWIAEHIQAAVHAARRNAFAQVRDAVAQTAGTASTVGTAMLAYYRTLGVDDGQ